jgi:hypothetical protein
MSYEVNKIHTRMGKKSSRKILKVISDFRNSPKITVFLLMKGWAHLSDIYYIFLMDDLLGLKQDFSISLLLIFGSAVSLL